MSKSSSIRHHAFESPNSEGGHHMDEPHDTTLIDVLTEVPDPRKPRGTRYSWRLLRTVIGSALASGERNGHSSATWVAEHATKLRVRLRLERGQLPRASILRRARRRIWKPAGAAALRLRIGSMMCVMNPWAKIRANPSAGVRRRPGQACAMH